MKKIQLNARWATGIVLGVAAVAITATTVAEGIPSPDTMYYSGVLEDNGEPVVGTRNVIVRLFDDPSVGSMLCASAASGVAFDEGRFRVALNEGCVDVVRDNANTYVEVQIDSETFPRTALGAVPYAVEAEHAVSATSADEATLADEARDATGALEARLTAIEDAIDVPEVCGYTAPTDGGIDDGSQNGHLVAAEACQALAGCGDEAHMCTVMETLRIAQNGGAAPTQVGWVASGDHSVSPHTSGDLDMSDCDGWRRSSSTYAGLEWIGSYRTIAAPCNTVIPVTCCE